VRFHAQHRFHGAPEAVARLLADPSFYADLDIPDLKRPELIEQASQGEDAVVRLRYEFVGDLDPIVHRFLGAQRLSWIQEVRTDVHTGRGTLGYKAEGNPRLLHGEATFRLDPVTLESGGEGTIRHLDGELVVALGVISGMAEHRIVPGLLRRLDIEAEALDERLRDRS
jgi:hypothetical protein